MDFKINDIVKIKKEVMEKTKKQRSRGKEIYGRWVPFRLICAGRKENKFEVIQIVGSELYLKWKDENNEKKYCWVYKRYFELETLVEAEDW